VVSASRQPQVAEQLSVPVSVITAEDIHYSGLTNIPEVLQFAPGMDVLKYNRFSYAIGVRGLHELSSDRVQSLVNGRLADNPIYGGPEYWNLPILMEDIERIEVVRGAGGAAWGANALTGVINIITKRPDQVKGWLGSTTLSEFGDAYTHIRWADTNGKWSWRTSLGYEDNRSSLDALEGKASYKSFTGSLIMDGLIGLDRYVVRDFSRNMRSDTDLIYKASEDTEIAFGLGYSHFESGDFEQMGYFPMHDITSDLVGAYARVDRDLGGRSGYIQWFGNFQDSNRPNYFHYTTSQNTLEGQLDMGMAGGHDASVGGYLRLTHINTIDGQPQEYVLPGRPYDEYSGGGFLIDRWKATGRLTVEGQVRADWYSETQLDWAARLASIYGLDPSRRHLIRLSLARAFRTPLIALRRVTVHRVPIPFDGYAVNLIAPGSLDNEHTWSIEAGYNGRFGGGLGLRLDTYFQRFEDLIGGGILAPTYYYMDNIDGGTAYGGECEISITRRSLRVSGWYAYNDFQTDRDGQFLRGMFPARHKAGMTLRLFGPKKWTVNVNYRYTDTTPASASVRSEVPASHRLDLTVAKQIAAGRGELMCGVMDIANRSHEPFIQCDTLTAHDTPGRMAFLRLQLRF